MFHAMLCFGEIRLRHVDVLLDGGGGEAVGSGVTKQAPARQNCSFDDSLYCGVCIKVGIT